jgi:hypothetical protein
MATSTRSGAIYGIGVYGVARYGVSNVAIVPDGTQALANTDSGLNISGDANHTVISVVGTGIVAQLGNNNVTGDAVTVVTDVQANGQVGDNLTFILDHTESVTGVYATGNTSAPTVVAKANIGVSSESGQGLIGTASVVGNANTLLTGVSATAELGTPTQKTVNRVPVTGVSATGSVGALTVTGTSLVLPISQGLSASVGNVIVVAKSVVNITGTQATGSISSVVVANNAVPSFSGVAAVTSVGNVAVSTTVFNYQAVANLYARERTVLVGRRSTTKERTVVVPEQNRIVYVEPKASRDRIVYVPAQARAVPVARKTNSEERTLLAA